VNVRLPAGIWEVVHHSASDYRGATQYKVRHASTLICLDAYGHVRDAAISPHSYVREKTNRDKQNSDVQYKSVPRLEVWFYRAYIKS
jgi:hypothetical protein